MWQEKAIQNILITIAIHVDFNHITYFSLQMVCCFKNGSCLVSINQQQNNSEYANDTKLFGAVDSLEGGDDIQKDLDDFGYWVHLNLLKNNKAKYKIIHLSQGNPQYQNRLEDELI